MTTNSLKQWPIDKLMSYDEYIHDEGIKEQKAKMYN